MTFEQLLYVEVLSHHNSLQKAADALHISKSGLSLAISELESELKIKIFERTNKGTEITQEGLQLLSTISNILQSKAKLENLAAFSLGQNKKQKISIRYINTMFKSFIEDFIDNYEIKYSNVLYDVSRSDTKTIINLVRNGEIDAGFIASSEIESELYKDLIFMPICHGKTVLAVSENHPLVNKKISFDDLKDQKFCIYDDIYHELLFDKLQYICGPLNLILKTDDYWAITNATLKLNAISIGRSLQAKLSREEKIDGYKIIDIGHLLNDNTTLGWLLNPAIEHSDLLMDMINTISNKILNELN